MEDDPGTIYLTVLKGRQETRVSSGRCDGGDERLARRGEGVRSQACGRPQRPKRPGSPEGAGSPALGHGPGRRTGVGLVTCRTVTSVRCPKPLRSG